MGKPHTLLEGKKRVMAELQIVYQNLTGRYMSKKMARETFEKIFGIMFDEVFHFGKFVFPSGYGQIHIKQRKRKLFPDREYKFYKPNYEDETGTYYITYVVKFKPGTQTTERLRQYKREAMGKVTPSKDDDFMQILSYFTENDDVE